MNHVLCATRFFALLKAIPSGEEEWAVEADAVSSAYEDFMDAMDSLFDSSASDLEKLRELCVGRVELRALQETENYKAKKKCACLFLPRQSTRPHGRIC